MTSDHSASKPSEPTVTDQASGSVGGTPVLVAAVDGDLRHEFANATYGEYFARSPQEITGRTLGEWLNKLTAPDSDVVGAPCAWGLVLDAHPTLSSFRQH